MKEFLMKNKVVRIVRIIALILLAICFIGFLFMKLWLPFGGSPSKEDKLDYAKRALNYKDGKFYNEHDYQVMYDTDESNIFTSEKGTLPEDEIPTVNPSLVENPSIDMLNVTWLGHSTLLLQMHGMNILIDPVFSDVTSPISFVGPKRFSDLSLTIDELPDIDIVVISHDHYDHLDYQTIKEIDDKVKNYIVPLGVENHLERWKVNPDKIFNMAWWEEMEINGLTIACAPARHNSARSLNDRFNTL